MVQAAEQARAAVSAELESLRAAASSDRTRLMEEGAAERAAELATAHETIAELESARAAAAIEFERTRTRLSEIEHELLAAQHENRLAQRQLDKLCTVHDDLVEDNVRLTAFLEEARAGEAQLRTRTEELQEQLGALESERTRLVGARELDAACEAACPAVAGRARPRPRRRASARGPARSRASSRRRARSPSRRRFAKRACRTRSTRTSARRATTPRRWRTRRRWRGRSRKTARRSSSSSRRSGRRWRPRSGRSWRPRRRRASRGRKPSDWPSRTRRCSPRRRAGTA
jgi:hypothetical protein